MGTSEIAPLIPIYFYSLAIFKANDEDDWGLAPLFVIAYADIMPGSAEGVPRHVQPSVARQQLVGIGTGAQIVHEVLKLLRILRTDIGSLSCQMLRITDAPYPAVHCLAAEARVYDDRSHQEASRFQQHRAAIRQIYHLLHLRSVLRILLQVQKLIQTEMRRQSRV